MQAVPGDFKSIDRRAAALAREFCRELGPDKRSALLLVTFLRRVALRVHEAYLEGQEQHDQARPYGVGSLPPKRHSPPIEYKLRHVLTEFRFDG